MRTLYIESSSPWVNGYIESFNGKLRDELLSGEIFYTLTEAKVLVEHWRREYNKIRPHSSLGQPALLERLLLLATRIHTKLSTRLVIFALDGLVGDLPPKVVPVVMLVHASP